MRKSLLLANGSHQIQGLKAASKVNVANEQLAVNTLQRFKKKRKIKN